LNGTNTNLVIKAAMKKYQSFLSNIQELNLKQKELLRELEKACLFVSESSVSCPLHKRNIESYNSKQFKCNEWQLLRESLDRLSIYYGNLNARLKEITLSVQHKLHQNYPQKEHASANNTPNEFHSSSLSKEDVLGLTSPGSLNFIDAKISTNFPPESSPLGGTIPTLVYRPSYIPQDIGTNRTEMRASDGRLTETRPALPFKQFQNGTTPARNLMD
jgi:hypothetical protein